MACSSRPPPVSCGSNKRRYPSTAATEPCGGGDKSAPTAKSTCSTARHSASLSRRNRSINRKGQLQVARRLTFPLVILLLVFLWVVGIATLCQHRRHLMTGQGSFLRSGEHRPHQQQALVWNNDIRSNELVHVIQTRFMQYQGHLIELGRARLELFEVITLPSVVHQTTLLDNNNNNNGQHSFLWIIRTDPNLAPELRARLIQLVEPYPFVVLVGSNENPEGFRGPDCVSDMTDSSSVWSGRLETVLSYHEAAQSHPVLETRLDADDGLLLDFVQLVQADAEWRFNNNNNNNNWMVWCAKNHMEWQYASPWKADPETGSDDQGGLIGVKSKHCVTAGLTFGYGVGTSPTQIPSHKHQQLHGAIPACDATAAASRSGSSGKKQPVRTTHCLARIEPPGSLPATIRARTPTSAGMEHVLTGSVNIQGNKLYLEKVKGSGWENSQRALFEELPKLFGIQPFAVRKVKGYITKHLPEILSDAIAGQCTRGHSCKEESARQLQQLLEELTK